MVQESASPKASQRSVEVFVDGAAGLPPDSVVSLRAAGIRKQKPLSRCAEPFIFKVANGPLKTVLSNVQLDVLSPVATSGCLETVTLGQQHVELQPCLHGSHAPAPGMDAATPARVSLRVSEGVSPAQERGLREAAAKYLEEHMVQERLQRALTHLIKELPDDPIPFLAQHLMDLVAPAAGNKVSVVPASPVKAIRVTAGQLHTIPNLVGTTKLARVLDFGSGETGVYTYEQSDRSKPVKVTTNKVKAAFMKDYVDKDNVDGFCDVLDEEFKFPSSLADNEEIMIAGGCTGVHREMISKDSSVAGRARDFLNAVSKRLRERHGRKTGMMLFVPTGVTEAELELRATQFLAGRTNLLALAPGASPEEGTMLQQLTRALIDGTLERMPRDDSSMAQDFRKELGVTDELPSPEDLAMLIAQSPPLQQSLQSYCFSGVLAAGGGSCQLSTIGHSHCAAARLLSVPVGNKVPEGEGIFSKTTTEAERAVWRDRVQDELRRAVLPQGLRGLYVGISASFYGAQAAGVADRLVGKREVVDSLAKRLEELEATDLRTIANLTLIRELVQWVFADDACFVFKRNWIVDGEKYVATWTLGMFLEQMERIAVSAR